MLSAIVRVSLRFRGVIIALGVVAVAYGIYSLGTAKYDVFPEFATPQISIQTEAPGLSPEQVEVLVTQRTENALNGAPGIQSIRSESVQGLSLIIINFDTTTDIYRDRQDVAERLATLSGVLPSGTKAPVMTPLTSSTGDLMTIGLVSDKLTLMQLRTLVDWVLVPRLLAVQGVAKASVYGGDVRQIQIQIDSARMIARELAIDDVLSAARRATGVRGAGFVDTRNQRIVIRSQGEALSAVDIGRVVVAHQPSGNVTLADVGRVIDAPAPPISDASVMGQRAVIINTWAQYRANTLETTAGVERALDQMSPILKANNVTIYPAVFRAANFIELATHNITVALLLGAFLVMAVLFLFLSSFRAAAISCTAIPLSLLLAIALLQYLGYSLNTLTLGGLAIAIGVVVDDAVIDVENIQRRLRENHGHRPVLDVIFEASLEVRGAVVYASFAVALVFVPVLTMSGLAGRLFAPMALAYIFSILASLMVALTITPALCALLLRGKEIEREERHWLTALKSRYRSVVLRVEQYPGEVIGAVAFITIAGLALFPFLGRTFLPELHENHYLVHIEAAPGTSIQESARIGAIVQHDLMKLPFVRYVGQRVGRAESDDVYGPQSSEIEVDLKPDPPEDSLDKIRDTLNAIPGIASAINTFLAERIEETISGYTAPVVAEVVGNDLDVLDAKAQEVSRVLSQVPGATDVQVQSPPGTPELVVRLRPADVARWGFDPVDVLDSLRVAYSGDVAGEIFEGNRVFDVAVILPREQRNAIDSIGSLPLRSPSGTYVRLRDIADVVQSSGRYVILHKAARRVQTITCNVAGRDVASFVADARRAVAAKVSLPSSAYIEFTGAAEAEARSRRDLLIHSAIVLVGIALLLTIVMRTARNLALVALNLPFALVGGVIAALITREPLSVGSMVGFVTLFGITLRNSIMMISHYDHLVAVEGASWNLDTVIRGASERLVPIVMTSVVTALGLLPLAIGRNAPGREIEGAMAIVILGGLVTSTILNLLVLPTVAHRYGRFGH
ncbi:MAG TPA: efflux RND transporter permease subunit [Thermoanaerobaculia bacterium]|nr:efflux RND transporter permease subunit [Thermoanaerobaculia bacterium]